MAKIIQVTQLGQIPRNLNHPFPVKNIGHVRLNSDSYSGYHRNNIEFCIRLRSSAPYAEDKVGDTLYRTPFPHVFVKQPPALHTYSYSAFREAFFIIYPSSLKTALKNFGFPLEQMAIPFALTDTIQNLIQQITDLLQESDVSGIADQIDCLAQTLLVTILNSKTCVTGNNPPDDSILRLQRLSSYLKNHYTEKMNLETIARQFGFSRRNFFRLWKHHFSTSPTQYILRLKLDEACRLLENRSLSIKEIAEQLNFADSTYFIATFKKHLLQTPQTYRNTMFK